MDLCSNMHATSELFWLLHGQDFQGNAKLKRLLIDNAAADGPR